jgi:N-acyl amino acid synthase of PEP-CTERM/exosortase system
VFRLRHKVFCEELGFYPLNSEGRERDEHHDHSRHMLLRCLRTGVSAGCVRVVLASRDRPELTLPSEKICAGKIDLSRFDPADCPRESIAEISRLVVTREFRRGRRAESGKDAAAHANLGTPAHPPRSLYAQLGLYLGAIALAHRLGIETLLFLIEPRLAIHFRRLGFPFRQISGPVECRGTCVLSMASVGDPVMRLPFHMRRLYRFIDGEIAESLSLAPAAVGFHRFAQRHARIHSSRTRKDAASDADDPPPWASSLSRSLPIRSA